MIDPWWFRLDEVLRLATHATVCAEHRITRAQAAAFGPDGPALILTDTADGGAALTSNGVPGWHDHNGVEYTAPARAWRPTAGTAGPERHPLGYLPLRHTSSGCQRPLVDLLRAASVLDQNWVAVDRHAAPLRYADAVHVSGHRTDLAPAGARWRPAVVECSNGLPQRYPALVVEGYTTADGSAIARFDRDTVTTMVADCTTADRAALMPGELPVLRLDGDVLIVCEETDDGPDTGLVEVDRCHRDRDGLFGVCAHLWPWQVTDDRLPLRTRTRLRLTPRVARLRRR